MPSKLGCRPAIARLLTVRFAASRRLRVGQAGHHRPRLILYAQRSACRAVATWRDAVEAVPGGARLLVEVAAGARAARLPDGDNPWRNRVAILGIRVRAPAQEGRANEQALARLAAFFGVPRSQVLQESGAADSRKALLVQGVDQAAAEALLHASLEVRA